MKINIFKLYLFQLIGDGIWYLSGQKIFIYPTLISTISCKICVFLYGFSNSLSSFLAILQTSECIVVIFFPMTTFPKRFLSPFFILGLLVFLFAQTSVQAHETQNEDVRNDNVDGSLRALDRRGKFNRRLRRRHSSFQ